MGQRGTGARFMPNRLVFPGGAVDRTDATAPAAAELRPEVLALLCRNAKPRLARALAFAVTRELEEETALSLGTPPRLDCLDYLCRAVTPPTQPIRFNARFFVADAARVTGTVGGSGELEGLRWYAFQEALDLDLALVTREVLKQLLAWLDLSDTERERRDQVPVFNDRKWRTE